MKNKKILLTFILCILNISLFASVGNYWSLSSTLPDTYDLQQISVTNLYEPDSKSTEAGTKTYNGYFMGEVIIDFNKGLYSDFFSGTKKNLISRSEGAYSYTNSNPWTYNNENKSYIIDEDKNFSIIKTFVYVTRKDNTGSILDSAWYNVSKSYYFKYNDNSIFKNLKTDSLTFKYYSIIDRIGNLKISGDWELYIPNFSSSSAAKFEFTLIQDDTWKLNNTGDNPTITNSIISATYSENNSMYTNRGTTIVGNDSNNSDIYSLKILIEKEFNDTTQNFFDGLKHKYYSLDFYSYKYNLLTEDPFSVVLEIRSAHDWFLNLDNKKNPSDSEKIAYNLYLNYNNDSSILINDSQNRILINNIKSSNISSKLFLKTQSVNADPTVNTKGEYQDTI